MNLWTTRHFIGDYAKRLAKNIFDEPEKLRIKTIIADTQIHLKKIRPRVANMI